MRIQHAKQTKVSSDFYIYYTISFIIIFITSLHYYYIARKVALEAYESAQPVSHSMYIVTRVKPAHNPAMSIAFFYFQNCILQILIANLFFRFSRQTLFSIATNELTGRTGRHFSISQNAVQQ